MARGRAQSDPERASKRLKPSHNIQDATEKSLPNEGGIVFKDAWRALRKEGWFPKPPRRGLDDRYRYVRPGGNPDGVEGVDFFLGEKALTDFYNLMYGKYAVCDSAASSGTRTDSCGSERVVSHDTATARMEISSGDAKSHCRSVEHEQMNRSDSFRVGVEIEATTTVQDDEIIGAKRLEAVALCAVCQQDCSTARQCSTCAAYLHHFCSHDVCAALELRGPDGHPLSDFGDASFCSKQCYETAVAPIAVIECSSATQSIADNSTTFESSTVFHFGDAQGHLRSSSATPAQTQRKQTPAAAASKTTKQPTAITRETRVVSTAKVSTTKSRATVTPKTTTKKATMKVGVRAPPKQTVKKTTKKSGATATPKTTAKKQSSGKTKKSTAADAIRKEFSLQVQGTADTFLNAQVAFSPAQEDWMPTENYSEVGGAYLVGVVTRYSINNVKNDDGVCVPRSSFEIRWVNTAFQTINHVHGIVESIVRRDVGQFVKMQKNNVEFGESWSALCTMVPRYTDIPSLAEDFEEIDEAGYREWSAFRSHKELHIDLCPAEVEAIEGMTFSPTASLEQVPGLFTHADGTTTTRLQESSKKLFGQSATSSFFAFLPLSFWKQVVVFSNEYAVANATNPAKPIELDELIKFLGILWYMTLVDKGEMRNYWLDDEEAKIFPGASSTSLSTIMSWRRYIYIRSNLAFRGNVTDEEIKRDPAAKIRPLITMLKKRCGRHVIPGRNVAVDEASIACRSKYARHLIVYNPRKPTGKYHFKLYVCCCSTTWLVLGFKLHCISELEDRMTNVVPESEIARLSALTKQSSEIRKHVIEVTNSLKGSRRVVNTDNFYTSCMLLESLRTIGLYGRGTVRASSKHFPRFTMIQPSDEMERGCMKQGVCVDKHIVAASWVDGSIVNVISNADDSGTASVYRRIKQTHEEFKAPRCVGEYNAAMQGVDRHDQLRGRFSIADGHSFNPLSPRGWTLQDKDDSLSWAIQDKEFYTWFLYWLLQT